MKAVGFVQRDAERKHERVEREAERNHEKEMKQLDIKHEETKTFGRFSEQEAKIQVFVIIILAFVY